MHQDFSDCATRRLVASAGAASSAIVSARSPSTAAHPFSQTNNIGDCIVRHLFALRRIAPVTASLALTSLLAAPAAIAASDGQQLGWVGNFVRAHDGKAFCIPPGKQLQDYVDLLAQYKQAHPELEGVLGGQSVLSAFREAYPCPTEPAAAPAATVEPAAESAKIAESFDPARAAEAAPTPSSSAPATPRQESSAAVDTARIVATLAATIGHENDQLVAEIEGQPGNYPPPVLFALTNLLYLQGRTDDAIFWLSAARLRANFDVLRSADATAALEVGELMKVIPLALRRAQFDDLAKLRTIVSRAVQWDERTPCNYDYRWINHYRTGAADAGAPREQWPALAARTRADYVASLDAAITQIEARR
ncbi:hypothetical protein J8I26_21170 [Herbaspirillum sp. LeCh32-8]|uniref:Rap1a/Tai family immunity protein n=1 Tax=Herbaspirillum sp. LeCh32-8 TaxID=2821356 RepID=UPI001AE8EE9F|nr:Rap1a/Tai family immunity protein [Herbaspirillum sp. LeCh32-8]MBP0600638.1 hypothetical protein [Herbaspirillum sp. LeCh32-8]